MRSLEATPGCRVTHVADLDATRLGRFAHLPTSTEVERALADCDAVVVATPASTHARLAARALELGRHVLVEKPLALEVREAETLGAQARSRGLVLMVGHVYLFHPAVRVVKQLLEERAVGRVRALTMTRANLGPVRTDVDAAFDLMAHDLSLARHWLGAGPLSVRALGAHPLGTTRADSVQAQAHYLDGVAAQLTASWVHPRKVRELTITGEEGMLVFDELDVDAPVRLVRVRLDDPRLERGAVQSPQVPRGEPLMLEVRHFVECCLRGREPLTGADFGAAVVGDLCAVRESLAAGGAEVFLSSRQSRPGDA